MYRRIPSTVSNAARLAVFTLLSVLCLVPLAQGQRPVARTATAELDSAAALELDKKVFAEAKNGSEIMANLTHLSDIIGPRLTGSAALQRANEWAAAKMKEYGLSDVHQEPWTIPVGWERGTATGRIIEPDNSRSLSLAAQGWSPGTKGKVQADVLVVTAKDTEELAAYKGKLKGVVVLLGAPSRVRPISQPPEPRRAPGAATTPGTPAANDPQRRRAFSGLMAFRRELMDFLSTEGAAAVLMDAGKPQGLLTTTGGWRGQDRHSAADPIPALYVAHEHYALLHRLATRAAPARTRIELEVTNKFIPGPIAVNNTVGELPGSEKPEEFVILGAHLDSWDLAQGTTDNGTGSVVVLEAARLLTRSGMRPRRTIRFVLFTGEEQGLHGSKAYVKQHKDELSRISMCMVHDTGTGKVVGLGLQGRQSIQPILQTELASLKDLGVTDINLRGMGGSDHASFEQVGVPGFAVQQDMSEYFLTHHSQSDTLDKARESDLMQGAQVMAVAARRVADLPTLLPRDKKEDKAKDKATEKKEAKEEKSK
jgi:hypothetical protein